jgi:hypothetical protein
MVRVQFNQFNSAVEEAGLPARPSRVAARLAGPEAILAALVEWTRRYGDVPTLADWDPHRARRLGQEWRIARYRIEDLAGSLRALASARRAQDPVSLHAALVDIAAAGLAWAGILGSEWRTGSHQPRPGRGRRLASLLDPLNQSAGAVPAGGAHRDQSQLSV